MVFSQSDCGAIGASLAPSDLDRPRCPPESESAMRSLQPLIRMRCAGVGEIAHVIVSSLAQSDTPVASEPCQFLPCPATEVHPPPSRSVSISNGFGTLVQGHFSGGGNLEEKEVAQCAQCSFIGFFTNLGLHKGRVHPPHLSPLSDLSVVVTRNLKK